jgi:hypothetical protein
MGRLVNCKEVGAETAKNSRLDVPPLRLGLDTVIEAVLALASSRPGLSRLIASS